MKISVEFELRHMNRHGTKDKPTDQELLDWFLDQFGLVVNDGVPKRYWKDADNWDYYRIADVGNVSVIVGEPEPDAQAVAAK